MVVVGATVVVLVVVGVGVPAVVVGVVEGFVLAESVVDGGREMAALAEKRMSNAMEGHAHQYLSQGSL